ncbi:MAG: radical SAM protein [Methanosarcinales archaeon]|nr:radical SAM protein [Methanosarcinales archaeon]
MPTPVTTPRSYTLYHSPLLQVTASVEDGRIRVKSRGVLARTPVVRASLEMVDGQIPARAGDELFISTWFPPVPSTAFNRLVRSRVLAAMGWRTPDQVTISITEECPNRCRHCALPDSGRRLHLAPEKVSDIVRQALDLGTTLVIFDGGEPSLYRELPQVVRSVDQRAVSTLFTSGAGFSRSLALQLKEAGLQAVNVSLDSPVAEEHDAMRGRSGVFQDAMQAVGHALDAGLLVDLYVVLRRDNVHQLEDFHRLAREVGAHELTLFEVVPTGRRANDRSPLLTEEDHRFVEDYVSRAPAPRIFSVPSALRRFGCFAGSSWLHITPGGEVYPCACLPESWGSVNEEPLSRIWRRMRRFPHKGSRTCPMRR